jgi:hypothetical protein
MRSPNSTERGLLLLPVTCPRLWTPVPVRLSDEKLGWKWFSTLVNVKNNWVPTRYL